MGTTNLHEDCVFVTKSHDHAAALRGKPHACSILSRTNCLVDDRITVTERAERNPSQGLSQFRFQVIG